MLVLLNVQSPIYPQPAEVSEHPHIRTFHARHGRMSARREFALNDLLPKYEVSRLNQPVDIAATLETDLAIVDFGSGMGFHALRLAAANPHVGVLAMDVHTVGLLAIAETATEQNLVNILTHHGDGLDVLKGGLKQASIDEVHVLFPDPWPKVRHHKRRLITNSFLDIVTNLLKPGGQLIFVTDDESYFASAKTVFSAFGKFDIEFEDWDVPLTTYHQRALRLGHTVSQLSARKI